LDQGHFPPDRLVDAPPLSGMRGPPKYVRCLLPIWGDRYVRQFLDVGLPTWVAEGNLPALARTLPTNFVLLTTKEDEGVIQRHPMFERLKTLCPVVIHRIDHLITNFGHSTTITLAYAEAVRSVGLQMLDTCFFFLVSDYIVADRSFSNVLKKMKGGCSGVQVGNFQVVQEDATPWLSAKRDSVSGVISFSSRELMGWGLSHLHPATVANIVNDPSDHNDHTNRLFWRVDDLTLIGRFYLMHMICVRPERIDFVVGSSCDYSFIPEMCPSDNVAIIDDSDEYLVVEMQPRAHEAAMLRAGPQTIARVARTLSKWTTARHRKNAETTVVFHAGEIQSNLQDAEEEASRFIASVRDRLGPPNPFRNHPYWMGAIASFKEAMGLGLTRREMRRVLGLEHPDFNRGRFGAWLSAALYFGFFGKRLKLRSWHPRWPDHELVLKSLSPTLQNGDKKHLFVSDRPSVFTTCVPDGGGRNFRIQRNTFVRQPPNAFETLCGTFDACLVEIEEKDMLNSAELIDRIASLMKNDATIFVSVYNQRKNIDPDGFTRLIELESVKLLRHCVKHGHYYFVQSSKLRWISYHMARQLGRFARRRPIVGMPALAIAGLPLALCILVGNRLSRAVEDRPPNGVASSFLMIMNVEPNASPDACAHSSDRLVQDSRRLRDRLGDDKTSASNPGAWFTPDLASIVGETRSPADAAMSPKALS
jgi:hypothetical protein